MGYIAAFALIVCGILAAASKLSQRPQLKGFIDALTPYQGGIGFGLALWGVWILIWSLLNLSVLPLVWLIATLGCGALCVALGLLLGFGLLQKFVFRHSDAAGDRAEALRAKLVPHQVRLGFAGIAWGVFSLVAPHVLI